MIEHVLGSLQKVPISLLFIPWCVSHLRNNFTLTFALGLWFKHCLIKRIASPLLHIFGTNENNHQSKTACQSMHVLEWQLRFNELNSSVVHTKQLYCVGIYHGAPLGVGCLVRPSPHSHNVTLYRTKHSSSFFLCHVVGPKYWGIHPLASYKKKNQQRRWRLITYLINQRVYRSLPFSFVMRWRFSHNLIA